ncbi:MAG: NADH-quinone oxidoreductase subunit M [Verrucomicrobiota bacterium]
MSYWLEIFLVVPVIACLAIVVGAPAKRTALLATLINLIGSLALAIGFDVEANGFQFANKCSAGNLAGFFEITWHLGVDGLSLPLVLLTTVVSFVAVCVAHEDVKRAKEFYICILLVSLGGLGAFLSVDLFFLYVFHEVALIPTFLLIGIWGTHDRKFAATQMTLYLMLGSMILLAGLLAFYFYLPDGLRTFNLETIQNELPKNWFRTEQQAIIFPLLLVGFGILISLWPFHSWAPRGYATSPVSAVMLHAGVLKKFGLYGLIRLAVPYLPEGVDKFLTPLLVLLLFNVLYVGLVTIWQKELNLMLGYSSVMHMGYLFLGFASMNVIGVSGMVVLMVAHGLSAALLFGLAGEIRERVGTLRMSETGGLASKAPWLSFYFIVGAMASIGLPGLGNFAGELMIYFGAWKAELYWATILAVWGIVISAVYMLRAVRNICFGELSEQVVQVKDLDLTKSAPYLLLVLGLVIVGVFPNVILQWVEPVVSTLLGKGGA